MEFFNLNRSIAISIKYFKKFFISIFLKMKGEKENKTVWKKDTLDQKDKIELKLEIQSRPRA